MVFLGKAADLVIVNLLWILCSIPIVTAGASAAALYYVAMKMVRNEGAGVVKLFFHSFKENLKQGIGLSIIFLLGAVVLFFDFRISMLMGGSVQSMPMVIFLMLSVLYLGVMLYAFPLQAQFINTVPGTLKNALLLSIRHFPSTILMLVVNLLPVAVLFISWEVLFWMIPAWLFLVPAANARLCAGKFVKIFAPIIEAHSAER